MAEEKKSKGILVSAAEALGAAAGKVASIAGAAKPTTETADPPAAPAPKREIRAKLAPKNKARLPRKEKKALQVKTALAEAKAK